MRGWPAFLLAAGIILAAASQYASAGSLSIQLSVIQANYTPGQALSGLISVSYDFLLPRSAVMQAYMNEQAWEQTLATGYANYWSTSRNELWRKGATSGDWQKVKEIYLDCDNDAVLLLVEQQGKGACHTGSYSCFYTKVF